MAKSSGSLTGAFFVSKGRQDNEFIRAINQGYGRGYEGQG